MSRALRAVAAIVTIALLALLVALGECLAWWAHYVRYDV